MQCASRACLDGLEPPCTVCAIGRSRAGYRSAGHGQQRGTEVAGSGARGAHQREVKAEQKDKVVGDRAVRLYAGGKQAHQANLTSSYCKLELMNNKNSS